ncbi:hypothetical protein DEU56DRAFT_727492 [Suillus clintonianus]|uniref:uncharacterized protein n=1 Tax=Suillus clintonianus TaxID=1904413 RepID=UPI001B8798C4|nr:uncharacterized protein DEU56DRAFT_727492 [Suillus clintonianus]KAG2152699.1 hypothetical protein DEU56DRAFT_727492 [Suillus clintonianus]
MVELVCLGQALSNIHGLSLETILTFVTLASAVKEDMILAQPATYDVSTPPDFMPPSVSLFLGSACSLTQDSVRICWSTLKHDIWKDRFTLHHNTHSLFEQFGYPHGLTYKTFYPPFKMCTEATCERRANGLLLNKVEQVRVVYVSLEHGTMPAYDVAMRCERCKITYHHNYKVSHGDKDRIYYDYTEGLPDAIQVGTHHYVDIGVGQLWKTMMHVACTSGTNCARIYNSSVSRQNEFPLQWPSPEVTLDHVWDTFIIISLLEDCRHRKRSLIVKQTGTQSERFNDAMAHRNQRMRSFGQPDARRHKCTKCCRVYEASTDAGLSVNKLHCRQSH